MRFTQGHEGRPDWDRRRSSWCLARAGELRPRLLDRSRRVLARSALLLAPWTRHSGSAAASASSCDICCRFANANLAIVTRCRAWRFCSGSVRASCIASRTSISSSCSGPSAATSALIESLSLCGSGGSGGSVTACGGATFALCDDSASPCSSAGTAGPSTAEDAAGVAARTGDFTSRGVSVTSSWKRRSGHGRIAPVQTASRAQQPSP